MKKINWKRLVYDLFIDSISGLLIGIGIYNFAANAEFPLAGISGIALIFYRLFGLPIGWGTMLMNIPIAIGCYKTLGRELFCTFCAVIDHYFAVYGLYCTAVSGLFR